MNTPQSPKKRSSNRWRLTPLALLALPATIYAQADSKDKEEVFELSPFSVDGSEDEGYRAANTLAGSRLNTQLKDTSATISAYTKEFLDDLGATDLEDALDYSASAEVDVGGLSQNPGGNDNVDSKPAYNFRLRGFRATRSRNFFRYDLPIDVFNTERLDESRGPNSSLFGIGSGGGIINTTTKQARLADNFRNLQIQAGDNSLKRVSLDLNQVLLEEKLAVRVNLLREDSEGWRHNTEKNDERFHVAATWKIDENTTLRAEMANRREITQTRVPQIEP